MSNPIIEQKGNIAKLIIESINISDYQNDDFIEVGIIFFRDWVKNEYGEKISKYPISYLNKKYGEKFIDYCKSKLNFSDQQIQHWGYRNLIDFKKLGVSLVQNSLYSFVDVTENKSWFDSPTNVKIWDKMIKSLNLPPYLTFNVVESRPRFIEIDGYINFEEYIRSNISLKYPSLTMYLSEMKKFLTRYAGQTIGNPAHGELKIDTPRYSEFNFVGFDEWVKKVFNKKIKPEIKKTPIGYNIRTMVCKIETRNHYHRPIISILINRMNRRYEIRMRVLEQVNQFLVDNGYNPKNLFVDVV